MFDQFKKALGRVLGGGEKDLVEKTFTPVAADDRSLPGDVAEFIATGEPSSVLRRATAVADISQKVGILSGGLWSLEGTKYSAHHSLLADLGNWPALQLLRLAQVYFAASKATVSGHQFGRQTVSIFQGGYEWLELFLRQVTLSPSNVYGGRKKNPPSVSLKTIEEMVVLNQQDPTQLARAALIIDTTSYAWNSFTPIFRAFPDLMQLIERHPAVVREAFQHPDFKVRVHALETIAVTRADPRLWRDEIAAFMVVSSKLVRQAAEPLVRSLPDEFRALLERHAKEGDNETRALAVQACDRIYSDGARGFLLERRAEEKAKKVLEVLDDILRLPASDVPETPAVDDWKLPVLADPAKDAPLDASVRDDLRACLEKAFADAKASYERIKHQKWAGKFQAVPADDLVDTVFEQLQHGIAGSPHKAALNWRVWRDGSQRILEFAGHREFTLVHLVRWCVLWTGQPAERHWFHWSNGAMAAYAKTHGLPGLRELGSVFSALELDANIIGRAYLGQFLGAVSLGRAVVFKQPADGLWPYFAERLQLLEEALGAVISEPSSDIYSRYLDRYERRNALTALATFPRTPKRLLPILWDIALKGAKVERLDAQASLAREPDAVARLIASLGNGQMEVRAEAASWLGRMRAAEAKEPLLAALKKEKKEAAQSAMMLSLEALGVQVDKLVDRAALEKEAVKQAAKELPAEMSWFPISTLPPLHWADNGKTVPAELVRWLLVQAFKVKNPEPGPLLRTYASFFAKAEREKLARYIAEAWIAQDTIPAHNSDEAARMADAQTKQMAQHYAQYPQYAANWDEQKHYRAVYNHLLTVCKGSAIGSKGILAVAGAFGSGELATIVHRYVKLYYGMRGAQSKALLQMLAWIDDPNAIQVLLAIGNRFRTKGIQEEASRLCQELADRKNWTLDELADRTIPTAGLDEDGVLELDFGVRAFTARLTADFTLSLTNAEGREISSLPDPAKSDDEEKAKQAKQALSSGRKELKSVLKMQEERLYEAMCTQRQWGWGDFRRFILSHPIVGRLCERLVWCVVVDGKTVSTFRPLSDKTLTDTADEAVELGDEAALRLAHEATVTPAQRDAWLAHLADYKIEALFQQFGKPSYALNDQTRDETQIADFRGHVLESFKLRGRLTKLGYTRGQAQDGGWFMEYHKRFPGLGIQATINFSGSPLPEENRPVALAELSFERIGEDGGLQLAAGVRLGDLPPVLINECWNDIRLAAADGKGFDPNWEKTVQY